MALTRCVLIAVLVCGLAAAAVVCVQRYQVEQVNRAVEIVLDYREIATVAAASGSSEQDALTALREAGATSVALQEVSLEELLATGRAELLPWAASGPSLEADRPELVSLIPWQWEEQIAANLRAKFPAIRDLSSPGGPVALPAHIAQSGSVGVGYDQEAVQAVVEQAGLLPVARPVVDDVRTVEAVELACRQAREIGAAKVVWQGQSVLGCPGLLGATADALRRHHLTHCSIEFGKQLGDAGLSRRLGAQIVRLHSINENEMPAMSPQKAIERFVRAVRERNIRVCYVRLFLDASGDPLTTNTDFLAGLTARLETAGFRLGPAQPLAELAPSAGMLRPAAALAAVAGTLYLILFLWRLSAPWRWALCGLGLLSCLGGPLALGETWHKLAALLAAIVFPTLGVSLTRLGAASEAGANGSSRLKPLLQGAAGAPRRFGACWWQGAQRFAIAAACSVVGGVVIAALLSDLPYLVKLDHFTGVKLAQLAPLGLLAAVFLGRPAGPAREEGETLGDYVPGWRRALARTVEYGHVALLFAAMAVLGLLLVRSGNEPAVGVTGLELKFRSVLEDVLVVRPRTKEFLVAHPLLLLAFALNARGHTRGVWLIAVLGAVGQCSMVNTFCHLHTPLAVSLLRTVHGLWIGAALGTVLTWIVFRVVPRWHHRDAENTENGNSRAGCPRHWDWPAPPGADAPVSSGGEKGNAPE